MHNPTNLDALETRLDEVLPNHDFVSPFEWMESFDSITVRSIPRQTPPYDFLESVAKQQVISSHDNIKGTLVRISQPAKMGFRRHRSRYWCAS